MHQDSERIGMRSLLPLAALGLCFSIVGASVADAEQPGKVSLPPLPERAKARRWVVERTHSWLSRFRRILVRWEKEAPLNRGFQFTGRRRLAFNGDVNGLVQTLRDGPDRPTWVIAFKGDARRLTAALDGAGVPYTLCEGDRKYKLLVVPPSSASPASRREAAT